MIVRPSRYEELNGGLLIEVDADDIVVVMIVVVVVAVAGAEVEGVAAGDLGVARESGAANPVAMAPAWPSAFDG